MTDAGVAVEAEGLSKHFGATIALQGLSFRVGAGEIFGLVGPDGAGKTTALRVLAGVMRPDAGAVRVAGCDVVRQPDEAKRYLSYMPQRFGLYEDLTVDENLRFYADLFGLDRRRREERAAHLLATAGLAEFRGRLAGQLSGGMKQKLGLACALIHTPQVLLLDEPTTGVDPVSRRDFWQLLYGLLAEGVSVVIATAYLDEAERCHRLALLHRGRLLYCDTPAQLKTRLPGAVIAVVSAEGRRVRTALAAVAGVSAAVLVGDGVHLLVDDADRRLPELRRRLAEEAIACDRIGAITPTIEDLFVATVQGQPEAGHGGAA